MTDNWSKWILLIPGKFTKTYKGELHREHEAEELRDEEFRNRKLLAN